MKVLMLMVIRCIACDNAATYVGICLCRVLLCHVKTITIDDLGAAAAFYLQCCLGLTDSVLLLHVS